MQWLWEKLTGWNAFFLLLDCEDTCTYCSKLHFPLRNIFCVPQWWQLIWLDNKNYKVCRLNNLFNKACTTVHVTDHECVFQFLVLVEFRYCSSIVFFFYESFQFKPVIKGKEIKLWNLFQHLFSFFLDNYMFAAFMFWAWLKSFLAQVAN